jgi:hypothetical protein
VAGVEVDRVERIAARFHPNVLKDLLAAVVCQRDHVDEHLRELKRKERLAVARHVELAVEGGHGGAELVALGAGELRPVVPARWVVVAGHPALLRLAGGAGAGSADAALPVR